MPRKINPRTGKPCVNQKMERKRAPLPEELYAPLTIRTFGIQGRIARRTGISTPIISNIFNGNRRCTIEQAPKFEEAFIHFGIDINRWDMLYGVRPGEHIADYFDRKKRKEN